MSDDLTEYMVSGTIKISDDDINDAEGNVEQALQNVLGHTGFDLVAHMTMDEYAVLLEEGLL